MLMFILLWSGCCVFFSIQSFFLDEYTCIFVTLILYMVVYDMQVYCGCILFEVPLKFMILRTMFVIICMNMHFACMQLWTCMYVWTMYGRVWMYGLLFYHLKGICTTINCNGMGI
jgi:hypothetical protein